MKTFVKIFAIVLSLFHASSVDAQRAGVEWDRLNQEAMELYRQGEYDRAAVVAENAVKAAERSVGGDHPNVASNLNNLALMYAARGQYAKAEALYDRARHLGADPRSRPPRVGGRPEQSGRAVCHRGQAFPSRGLLQACTRNRRVKIGSTVSLF